MNQIAKRDMVVTRTGIVIGGAHLPPAPRPGYEAERIQSALLDKSPRPSRHPLAIAGFRLALAIWTWLGRAVPGNL
jgi:hypothetical protein